jgi:hypothetical protein
MSQLQPRPRRKKGGARPAAKPPGAHGAALSPVRPELPLVLEWTHNPWRQSPFKSAAALAICLALGWFASWFMHSALWALLGFLLVATMLSVLFLPARYRLDSRGVTVWFPPGVPNQRDWAHYRNAYFHSNLVYLTTMPRPSPLDPFRGHSLLFDDASPAGNRSVVQSYIEAWIRPARA